MSVSPKGTSQCQWIFPRLLVSLWTWNCLRNHFNLQHWGGRLQVWIQSLWSWSRILRNWATQSHIKIATGWSCIRIFKRRGSGGKWWGRWCWRRVHWCGCGVFFISQLCSWCCYLVVMRAMLKVIEGFHFCLARSITAITARLTPRGDWECPPVAEYLGTSGLWTNKDFIQRMQDTIVVQMVFRPIYKLCKGLERIPRTSRFIRWWEQNTEWEVEWPRVDCSF